MANWAQALGPGLEAKGYFDPMGLSSDGKVATFKRRREAGILRPT